MSEKRRKLVYWLSLLGLVVLIILLLLPARGTTRSPARRETCLSNLIQLGLALAMYSDQNHGKLPMDSATPTLVGSMKLLSNVAVSAKFLHCPNDIRAGAKAEANFEKLTTLNISYSYVPHLTWQDQPDSIVALDRIHATAAGSRWPTKGNHRGAGGNVLFNDGHAQWYNALPSALKDKDRREAILSP